LKNGRLISTQYQDHARKVKVEADRIEVEGMFLEVSRPTMTPLRFTAFRLFTLSVGRLAGLGRWLKRRLVKALIHDRRTALIRFKRVITFDEAGVSVCDKLSGPEGEDGGRVESLRWSESFTTIHMGSSRYFINHELDEAEVVELDTRREIDPKRLAGGVTLRRTVRW
jgi:hypothetical protein